jgi:hypothetical protein
MDSIKFPIPATQTRHQPARYWQCFTGNDQFGFADRIDMNEGDDTTFVHTHKLVLRKKGFKKLQTRAASIYFVKGGYYFTQPFLVFNIFDPFNRNTVQFAAIGQQQIWLAHKGKI